MNLKEYLKEQAISHVKEKAARDILNAIGEWRGNSINIAKRRWIFELIQNAVDCAKARNNKSLYIKVDWSTEQVRFRHNGGYFIPDEINSVIYGGSSKPYAVESEYLGRFGTGLLVAHVISKSFDVEGYLGRIENIDSQVQQFTLHVDREGLDPSAISAGIEACFSQFDQTVTTMDYSGEIWTQYTFRSDGVVPGSIEEGIKELKRNLIFVLAFNRIEQICINGEEFCLDSIDAQNKRVGGETIHINSDTDMDLQVAVLTNREDVVNLDGMPKIFVGMPLIETSAYMHFPFVVNSTKFEPVRERNALSYRNENNKTLLQRSLELYYGLVKRISESPSTGKLNNLVALRLIPDQNCAQNPLWQYLNTQVQETFKNIIDNIPLVRTASGVITISKARFPVPTLSSKKMELEVFKDFIHLLSQIEPNVPASVQIVNWLETAKQLETVFPMRVSLYTIQNMRDELAGVVERFEKKGNEWPYITEFAKKYNLADARAYLLQWFTLVDKLFGAAMISEGFIEMLLPDQNQLLGPLSWTAPDMSSHLFLEDTKDHIPEELKDIAGKIGRDVRCELVDIEFCEYNIVVKYVREKMTTEQVLNNLINNDCYKPAAPVSDWKNSVVEGWVQLFRWCLINGTLKKSFPIVCKDAKFHVLSDLDMEYFLVPLKHINIPEKYEELYPISKVLHPNYFDVEPTKLAKMLESLAQHDAFITRLPIYKSTLNLRHQKLKSIVVPDTAEISKVDHDITAEEGSISVLPFWDELIGGVQKKPENAKLLLWFVAEYLIGVDHSWRSTTEVKCSCKDKTHQIIPSQWLASIKSDKWVTYSEEGDDQKENVVTAIASKDSIIRLCGENAFSELLAANSDLLMELLPHLGFDGLDLKVSLESIRTNKPEKDIRKEVSGLVEVATSVPDLAEVANKDIDAFKELIKKHKKALDSRPIKDENRKVGKTVERVIKKLLEEVKFRTKKLKVETIYKGGDLEMWPVETDGYDGGEVEIASNSGVVKYTMEIKFTTSYRAHLSKLQSETAEALKKSYVLLVVKDDGELRSQLLACSEGDQISEEIASAVNLKSHVVMNIHTRLGIVPNPEEIEPDISGYWAKEKLWRAHKKLGDWLISEFGAE